MKKIQIINSARMTLSITQHLSKKKRAQNKNLKIKRKYQILLKKNKRLQIFI